MTTLRLYDIYLKFTGDCCIFFSIPPRAWTFACIKLKKNRQTNKQGFISPITSEVTFRFPKVEKWLNSMVLA